MSTVTALILSAGALWLALLFGYCYLSALPMRRSRTRSTRRGGYVKPPASRTTNHVTIRELQGRGTTGYTSSRFLPGDQWAGSVILAQRARLSRPTAPGWSGNATADRGANGQPPDSAGWRERLAEFEKRNPEMAERARRYRPDSAA